MTEMPSNSTAVPDEASRFASLLATGERVLVVRRRHWLTFIDAARWFALALLAGLVLGGLDQSVSDGGLTGVLSTFLGWGFWIFLLVGVAGVGWYFLAWQRERYLVTTRRVIEAGGVVNKYTRDTSLSMITDMLVSHPWLGRIFGYGEIDLLTASEAGTSKIRFLPNADEFKKSLLDARHEYELDVGGGRAVQAAFAPIASAPPVTVEGSSLTAEELDKSITHLADLRDRGLLTDEQFEEKKRDLLDRL
jgi:Bacterial PH domain/Short C-terminal domain